MMFRFWRLWLGGALFLIVAGIVSGWMLGHGSEGSGEIMQDTGPVVMAIRQVGQLHSTSLTIRDVVHVETHAEAADWAKWIPGATDLAHSATHNEVLVVADGTVEAGVDLARISDNDVTNARLANGRTGIRVHLPPIEVYPPNVTLHVEDLKSGLFWNDTNIVPKAQAQAARQFTAAAEDQHIREKAETAAIDSLQKLMQSLHHPDVEFSF